MPSFGENLRREREKRNISLEQISQSTKIGTRMLQALEEDRFSQLPGGIFNRGFVRAYARHLGLDDDQAVADYMEASGEAPPVLPEVTPEEPARRVEASADASAEDRQRPLPWGIFAAILLLLALALSIWSHRQKKHQGIVAPPSPAPAAAQQSVDDRAAQADTPQAPAPATASDANFVIPSPIRSTLGPAARVTPKSAPARSPATPPPETSGEPTVPPAPDEFVVLIQAREASWTAIIADGRTVFSGMLSAGDHRVVRGRKEVVVKAGNAGGLDLSFNQNKLDSQGGYGEVRTLTFGPAGMLSNTPATPPTE